MSRLVLDAGAFVGFERGDASIRARLAAARRLGVDVCATSPVIGQVWRDGARQALLARLVAATRVEPPDAAAAKRAGALLAATAGRDVVDALVVGLARHGDTIVTSDPTDIRLLLAAARTRAAVVVV